MGKQTARFYCHNCGTYSSDTRVGDDARARLAVCPTCKGAVTEVAPGSELRVRYCPQCELPVQGPDAIPPDGTRGHTCCACGTELVDPPDPAHNPISFPIALKVVGVVARLLLKSGAIENLEGYALSTDNRLDDLAARIASAMLRECAKL